VLGRRTGRVPGEQFEADVAAVALERGGRASATRQHGRDDQQRQCRRQRGESPRVQRVHDVAIKVAVAAAAATVVLSGAFEGVDAIARLQYINVCIAKR